MIVARTIDEARAAVRDARAAGVKVGFVPTMGFLHEGHLSLIDLAREQGANFVVVSIFVNPLQFGPTEDLERYPRDEERDRALLDRRGVDALFLPSVETMVPPEGATRVTAAGAATPLEGERRPGHFDGVATIVMKLFQIVQPDLAVFGQKDAQQCAVIRQLVRDLAVAVQIVVGPTRRESDGLALSSRNAYLGSEDRNAAPALQRALSAGARALEQGATDLSTVEAAMLEVLEAEPRFRIDYLRMVDPTTFEPPVDFGRDLLLVGAAWLGTTRLIDNIPLPLAAWRSVTAAGSTVDHERTSP